MKLRARFSDEITVRMKSLLPAALQTAWGERSCVTVIENLAYGTLAGIYEGSGNAPDFDLVGSFEGVLVVEINADDIDQLPLEILLANLLQQPVTLLFNSDAGTGEISEKCASRLLSSRDSISDTRVVHQLRFAVNGEYGVAVDAATRPGLMIGRAPVIGLVHEQDYVPFDNLAALL